MNAKRIFALLLVLVAVLGFAAVAEATSTGSTEITIDFRDAEGNTLYTDSYSSSDNYTLLTAEQVRNLTGTDFGNDKDSFELRWNITVCYRVYTNNGSGVGGLGGVSTTETEEEIGHRAPGELVTNEGHIMTYQIYADAVWYEYRTVTYKPDAEGSVSAEQIIKQVSQFDPTHTLPDGDLFTANANSIGMKYIFKGWLVDGEFNAPGSTITLSQNVTVTPSYLAPSEYILAKYMSENGATLIKEERYELEDGKDTISYQLPMLSDSFTKNYALKQITSEGVAYFTHWLSSSESVDQVSIDTCYPGMELNAAPGQMVTLTPVYTLESELGDKQPITTNRADTLTDGSSTVVSTRSADTSKRFYIDSDAADITIEVSNGSSCWLFRDSALTSDEDRKYIDLATLQNGGDDANLSLTVYALDTVNHAASSAPYTFDVSIVNTPLVYGVGEVEQISMFMGESATVSAKVDGAGYVQWYVGDTAYGEPVEVLSRGVEDVVLEIDTAARNVTWEANNVYNISVVALDSTDEGAAASAAQQIATLSVGAMPTTTVEVIVGGTITETHTGVTAAEADYSRVLQLEDDSYFELDTDLNEFDDTGWQWTLASDKNGTNVVTPPDDGSGSDPYNLYLTADDLRDMVQAIDEQTGTPQSKYYLYGEPIDEDGAFADCNVYQAFTVEVFSDFSVCVQDYNATIADDAEFTVELTMVDSDGAPISGTFDGVDFDEAGKATFSLLAYDTAADAKEIRNVPYGATITTTITPPDPDGDGSYTLIKEVGNPAKIDFSYNIITSFVYSYTKIDTYTITFVTGLEELAEQEAAVNAEWAAVPHGTYASLPDGLYASDPLYCEGWYLLGWTSSVGDTYSYNDYYTVTGQETFIAVWREARDTTITFSQAGEDINTSEETSEVSTNTTLIYNAEMKNSNLELTPSLDGYTGDDEIVWKWSVRSYGSDNHFEPPATGETYTLNPSVAASDSPDTYWNVNVYPSDENGIPYGDGLLVNISYDPTGSHTYFYTINVSVAKDGEIVEEQLTNGFSVEGLYRSEDIVLTANLENYTDTGLDAWWEWRVWNNEVEEDKAFQIVVTSDDLADNTLSMADVLAMEEAQGKENSTLHISVECLQSEADTEGNRHDDSIAEKMYFDIDFAYDYAVAMTYQASGSDTDVAVTNNEAITALASGSEAEFTPELTVVTKGSELPTDVKWEWEYKGNTEAAGEMKRVTQDTLSLSKLYEISTDVPRWDITVRPLVNDTQYAEDFNFSIEYSDLREYVLGIEYCYNDSYVFGEGTKCIGENLDIGVIDPTAHFYPVETVGTSGINNYAPAWTLIALDDEDAPIDGAVRDVTPESEGGFNSVDGTMLSWMDCSAKLSDTDYENHKRWKLALSANFVGDVNEGLPMTDASVIFTVGEASSGGDGDDDTEYTPVLAAYDADGNQITELHTIQMTDTVYFRPTLTPEYDGSVTWEWDIRSDTGYDNGYSNDPDNEDDWEQLNDEITLAYLMSEDPDANGWRIYVRVSSDDNINAGGSAELCIGTEYRYDVTVMAYPEDGDSVNMMMEEATFNITQNVTFTPSINPAPDNLDRWIWYLYGKTSEVSTSLEGNEITLEDIHLENETETQWDITVYPADAEGNTLMNGGATMQTLTLQLYDLVAGITATDEGGAIDDIGSYTFTESSDVTFTASTTEEVGGWVWTAVGRNTGVTSALEANGATVTYANIYALNNYETEWTLSAYAVDAEGEQITTEAEETLNITFTTFNVAVDVGGYGSTYDFIGANANEPLHNRAFDSYRLYAKLIGTLPDGVLPLWKMQPVVDGVVQDDTFVLTAVSDGEINDPEIAWNTSSAEYEAWISRTEFENAVSEESRWRDHTDWLVTLSAKDASGSEYVASDDYAASFYMDISNPFTTMIRVDTTQAIYTGDPCGETLSHDSESMPPYFYHLYQGELNDRLAKWTVTPVQDGDVLLTELTIEVSAEDNTTWDDGGNSYLSWPRVEEAIEGGIENYMQYTTWRIHLSAYESDGVTVYDPYNTTGYMTSIDIEYDFAEAALSAYELIISDGRYAHLMYTDGGACYMDATGITLSAELLKDYAVLEDVTYRWEIVSAGTADSTAAEQVGDTLTIDQDFLTANAGITEWDVTVYGTHDGITKEISFTLMLTNDVKILYPRENIVVVPADIGDDISLEIFALNATGYQWLEWEGLEVAPMEGQTGPTLELTNITDANYRNYSCQVTGLLEGEEVKLLTIFTVQGRQTITITMGEYTLQNGTELTVPADKIGTMTASLTPSVEDPGWQWDVWSGAYDTDDTYDVDTFDLAAFIAGRTETEWDISLTARNVEDPDTGYPPTMWARIIIGTEDGEEPTEEDGVTFTVNGVPYNHGDEAKIKPGQQATIIATGCGAAEGYAITYEVDGEAAPSDGALVLSFDEPGVHTISATATAPTRSMANGDGTYTGMLTLNVSSGGDIVAANPADPTDKSNTTNIDVTGILKDNPEVEYNHVYSIEITWGDMAFKYVRTDVTNSRWDAENHIWISSDGGETGKWELMEDTKLSEDAGWTEIFQDTDQSHIVAFNHSDLPVDLKIQLAETTSHEVAMKLAKVSGGVDSTTSTDGLLEYTLGRGVESEKDEDGNYTDEHNLYHPTAGTAAKVQLSGEPNGDVVSIDADKPTVMTTMTIVISKTGTD